MGKRHTVFIIHCLKVIGKCRLHPLLNDLKHVIDISHPIVGFALYWLLPPVLDIPHSVWLQLVKAGSPWSYQMSVGRSHLDIWTNFVHFFRILSLTSNLCLMTSRALGIGVLVNRDTISCEPKQSSASSSIPCGSSAKCLEFLTWCIVSPLMIPRSLPNNWTHCIQWTLGCSL